MTTHITPSAAQAKTLVTMGGSIPVIPLPAGVSWTYILSPIGPVGLAATPKGVCRVVLTATPRWANRFFKREKITHVFPHAFPGGKAIVAYLNGLAADLNAVPLDVSGTAFQKQVWEAARRIPAGATASYGQIARQIGRPKASRAVGAALGANPVPLLVPCHRVVGATGDLTGFAAGLDTKRQLLKLEQTVCH